MKKGKLIKGIKIIAFILIVFFLFEQITYVYRGEIALSRVNMAGFYAEEKDSLDVVIVGTSSTFSAIMPMDAWGNYRITAYDMCTNVLFQETIKYYIRELQKTQHPEVLVIDITPFLYGHSAARFSGDETNTRYNTDGLSWSKNRIDLIREIIPKGERTEYYFDLFYYHNNSEPDYTFLFNKKENIRKGYASLAFSVTFNEEDYVTTQDKGTITEAEYTQLLNIFSELDDFEGEVLFIEQPAFYTDSTIDICAKSEIIEEIVRDYGYDYLDMSKVRNEIGVDAVTGYSLDYLHFNSLSAENITDYLFSYLIENYDLKGHKEDSAYQKWDEQYVEWLEMKNELQIETEWRIEQFFATEEK